jgi:hypothetical protein
MQKKKAHSSTSTKRMLGFTADAAIVASNSEQMNRIGYG